MDKTVPPPLQPLPPLPLLPKPPSSAGERVGALCGAERPAAGGAGCDQHIVRPAAAAHSAAAGAAAGRESAADAAAHSGGSHLKLCATYWYRLYRFNHALWLTRGLTQGSSLLATHSQAAAARRLHREASLLHTPDRCRSSKPSSSMALGCQLLRTLHSRQGEQERTEVWAGRQRSHDPVGCKYPLYSRWLLTILNPVAPRCPPPLLAHLPSREPAAWARSRRVMMPTA